MACLCNMLSFTLTISCLGAAGFLLARHIYKKKQEKKPLMCPLRTKCEQVVTSDYSRLAGFPLEKLGMYYYGLVFLVYGFLYLFPSLHSSMVSFVLMIASAGAFLLSLYLVCVQAFALRAWCTWCLMSALLSTLIFSLSLFGNLNAALVILKSSSYIFFVLNALALIVGFSSTATADLFFFHYLHEKKISMNEGAILNMLSKMIWISLSVLILTFWALCIPRPLMTSDAFFFMKITNMIVISAGVIGLYLLIYPRLLSFSYEQMQIDHSDEIQRYRKWSLVLSSSTMMSWCMLFATTFVFSEKSHVPLLFKLYFLLVFSSILISHLVYKRITS